MRYTVLTSRTFHNRIAKSIGVIVGAALVATLLLPTAAQAQTPAAPMVSAGDTGTGEVGSTDAALTATWGSQLGQDSRSGSVAARIYRAWRRMGRCGGGVCSLWRYDFRSSPRE